MEAIRTEPAVREYHPKLKAEDRERISAEISEEFLNILREHFKRKGEPVDRYICKTKC